MYHTTYSTWYAWVSLSLIWRTIDRNLRSVSVSVVELAASPSSTVDLGVPREALPLYFRQPSIEFIGPTHHGRGGRAPNVFFFFDFFSADWIIGRLSHTHTHAPFPNPVSPFQGKSKKKNSKGKSKWGAVWDDLNAGDKAGVRNALEGGVDVNDKYAAGKTLLYQACLKKKEDIVIMLLDDFQADPNVEKGTGRTPIFAAASKCSEELVQKLIDAGADVNHEAKNGKRALNLGKALFPPVCPA